MMAMLHPAELNCHRTAAVMVAVMVAATIHVERGFDPGRLQAALSWP